jgi:putative sterol carrier protein
MSVDANAVSNQLREKVAARYGEVVQQAERRLEAAQREVDDLRAARGAVQFEVEGVGAWCLNIENGAMSVASEPLEAPFMTVVMSASDWERFVGGAIGIGPLGPGGGRGMGRNRIERVRAVKGAVRFVVTGLADGDWSATSYFGADPRPPEPQTTISVSGDAVEKLSSGELNPQMAFMQGHVRFTGDAALAMQLGMAMVV